jgi:hypothetical protein
MSSKVRAVYATALFVSILTVPLEAEPPKDRLVAGGQALAEGRPAMAKADFQAALEGFR